MTPLQLFAATCGVAQSVLAERRRFGHPSTRHAAIYACRRHLDGAVRVGALTAAQADAEARRAVLAVQTEPIRVQAERQGVFEHLRAGRRVIRHRDERGEWTLTTGDAERTPPVRSVVNSALTARPEASAG